MARNMQPIVKRCRALGISPAVMGYTENSKKNSTLRNPNANKRAKKSEYARQLTEKQKVKFIYGVLEKQFEMYYEKADQATGSTGEVMLSLLERRLDNVVFRLGLAKSRREARQFVTHGHYTVDGQTVNIDAQMVALEGIFADFIADVTDVAVGGSVHFTDNSWAAQLVSWNWEFEGGTPATSTEQNPVVTYNEVGTFDVRLTVTNADGESDMKYMPNYITASESYNMQNGTITTCNAMFYDDGGPNANYGNNRDFTMTFLPATEGGLIQAEFQSFNVEQNWDFLYIYDGENTSATQIGSYTGSDNPGTVVATNAAGALTFRFTSDSNVNKDGWAAHVRCTGITYDPLTVEVTAEPASIQEGESTQLRAIVTGGDGNYSFLWEPAETLNYANIENPIATQTD